MGASSVTFSTAVESAQEIYAQFHQQFPEGKLEDWKTTYLGHETLDFSNRYFTPKRDTPDMEHISFTRDEDPHGILEEMCKPAYIHVEENVIGYYCRIVDKKGKIR